MATVTGYTAARMKEIEDSAIIDGDVVGDNLILKRYDTAEINAGSVRGPQGIQGATGSSGDTSIQIVTSTTRPVTPFTGLMIYETDTKFHYTWNGTVWEYRDGVILCTSTSRPNNPFEGLKIYEIDTNKFLTYDGATWNLPKNVAGGLIGPPGEVTVSQAGIVTETDLTNLNTVTVVGTNRRVKISFQLATSRTVVDGYNIIRIKEGNDTLRQFLFFCDMTNASFAFSGFVLIYPTPGAHTYKISLQRATGTGTCALYATNFGELAIISAEDIGGV